MASGQRFGAGLGHWWRGVALGAAVCAMAGLARASGTAATPAGAAGAVAAASQPVPARRSVAQILVDLGDSSYDVRQRAAGELRGALARQVVQLATSDDPELSARLRETLMEQQRLIRWVVDTMNHRGKTAKEAIRWGLSEEAEPALVLALGETRSAQQNGMTLLAAKEGAEADEVLASLIGDADLYRSCAAIDAVYEREASPAVLDALWQIVRGTLTSGDNATQRPGFTGRHVAVKEIYRQAESPVNFLPAAKLLAKYKDHATAEALQTFLGRLPDMSQWNNYGQNDDRGAGLWTLAVAFKSDAIIAFVYDRAIDQRRSSTNGGAFYFSNRTAMLALFATLTGQSPGDYGVRKGVSWDPEAWCTTNEAAEDDAIKKAKEWWEANKEHKGGAANKPGATGGAATGPGK